MIGGRCTQINVYPWCQQMAHGRFPCAAAGQWHPAVSMGIKAQESSGGPQPWAAPMLYFTAEERRGSESKRLAFLAINCKHFQGFTMQAQLTLGHHLIIQTLTAKRNSVAKGNLNDLTFIQVRGRSSTYVRQGVCLNLRESLSWEVSGGQESMTRRASWQ